LSRKLPRLTLDFDGSVQSNKGHARGTAICFNKKKKGSRSYYPLFCTVAQTGQFFDLHHRRGNVHDSNGADQFMLSCFTHAKAHLINTVFESRMDSTFFNKKIMTILNGNRVNFTASVPFERFPQLKEIIEKRKRWRKIDTQWSYFETEWKPKFWDSSYRFIFNRKKTNKQRKGPLKL
jgi:Transposase DDE domain group 1